MGDLFIYYEIFSEGGKFRGNRVPVSRLCDRTML